MGERDTQERRNGRKEAIRHAVEFITPRIEGSIPEIAMVLGSGLGVLADEVSDPVKISYADIPGFPESTVEGHAGRLVLGELSGRRVVVMQGRFHFYEGHSMSTLAFPVRVMRRLGAETLVVTNAAGGVNREFAPGDLMLITDHIKTSALSPLRGPNDDEFGPRFNDMTAAYDPELRKCAREAADSLGIGLREGVYAFMGGPSYETPAEIRMLRVMGADAVGMSTVPEVISASHAGMSVLGISCITNMAAGVLDTPLDHAEVMETAARVRDSFVALVLETIRRM